MRRALERQSAIARNEKRLLKLKDAVRRLNESRKLVTRKVDLLCNDLVTAYGELSRQLDGVRTQEGFRKYISQAGDLEQLLCHGMDWILRQIGYCNVAVWLAAEENEFQLGAYMKYTIAGENDLVDAMRAGLVRQVVRDGAVHLSDEQVQRRLSPQELDYLADQTLMGVNCTYLGESLATIVIFRDGSQPFSEEDFGTLKAISPVFAVALASMVRHGQNKLDEESESDDSPFYNGEGDLTDFHDDEDHRREKKKKRDASHDSDWWKRGDPPPF